MQLVPLAPCLLFSVNMNILLIIRIRKLESEGEVEAIFPLSYSDYHMLTHQIIHAASEN